MNNLLLYCGLVDTRISASKKIYQITKRVQSLYDCKKKYLGASCEITTLWHCLVENKAGEDFFYKFIMFLTFSFLGPTIYDVVFVFLISMLQ